MRILSPISITPTMLTSSTVPETDYQEWSSGTAYTVGQRVMRLTTHHIYEALTATTGDTPETSPTKWLDLGATNRWRAFDQKVGTATTQAESVEWVIAPGMPVSAVGLIELVAETVRVRVSDPIEGEIYDRTRALSGTITVADWYAYFFEPVSRRSFAIFTDLPSSRAPTVTITISGLAGETVRCGVCLVGTYAVFADAVRYGAKVGIVDYSRKTIDDFGNTQITERAFSKRASWQMLIHNSDIDRMQRTLADLRATPALYIGSDRFESTLVYGYYRDFDITIDYHQYSECSIELEGLI